MTVKEIAEELGVAPSTVSRALSGKGRIGEATKKRVINYMAEHELLENRGNTKKRNGNLGVILPSDVYVSNVPYFQECILGICETAAVLGHDVLIATATANDISGIRTLVEKEKVDGIILTRSMEDDKAIHYLSDLGFPVGVTGHSDKKEVIQVDTDNEAAAEALTSFLIEKGYQRFALITDNLDYSVNRSRYKGFCKALRKNGIEKEKQFFYNNSINLDVIDSVINDLLIHKVECIVCGDDVICTKIMSSLQAEGYRIPRDISVASLYNSSNLDCFTPPVTTVNVSAKRIGNVICKQMIHYLTGKEYQPKTLIDYEILVRKSTKGL